MGCYWLADSSSTLGMGLAGSRGQSEQLEAGKTHDRRLLFVD